jgi:hypothetical protein
MTAMETIDVQRAAKEPCGFEGAVTVCDRRRSGADAVCDAFMPLCGPTGRLRRAQGVKVAKRSSVLALGPRGATSAAERGR